MELLTMITFEMSFWNGSKQFWSDNQLNRSGEKIKTTKLKAL